MRLFNGKVVTASKLPKTPTGRKLLRVRGKFFLRQLQSGDWLVARSGKPFKVPFGDKLA